MSTRKNQVDLLHGPILKSLVIFMIPMVISSAFQQLYNAVDTAIVGNYLGETSLAAIGACASIFELLVGFSNSMASGLSIVSARAFGSGDEDQMKKSVAGSIVIGLVTLVAVTLICSVAMKPLLHLINTPESIIEESYSYIRVICMWIVVMFAYNFSSAMLRAIGNSIMPLVFLVFSSLLNIVLDIFFITVLHRGVVGAAEATVIAQGVSAVLCIYYMLKKTKNLIPSREHFVFDKPLYADLAGQGYSMALMGSIVSCGSIILQSGINSLGTEIIAGHVAARKVYAICNLPFISMGIACSTFIGQNKGANQGDRILKAIRAAYIYDVVMAVIVTAFLWFAAPSLIHLISGSENPVILGNGAKFLRVVGPFYAVLGILMVTRMSLQGIGAKIVPLISSVIEFVGKILFAKIFIPMFAYNAVIWCEPLIWCAMTAQLLYAFYTNSYVKETKKQLRGA